MCLGGAQAALLGGRRQVFLKLCAELNVLDQDRFNANAPCRRGLRNDALNFICNTVAIHDGVLEIVRANDLAQRRLRAFRQRRAHIVNLEDPIEIVTP
jgi:hypothetical protein